MPRPAIQRPIHANAISATLQVKGGSGNTASAVQVPEIEEHEYEQPGVERLEEMRRGESRGDLDQSEDEGERPEDRLIDESRSDAGVDVDHLSGD